MSNWLTTKELSELSGSKPRAIRTALQNSYVNNATWKGASLQVRVVSGMGRGGKQYEVNADSLPELMQLKFYKNLNNQSTKAPQKVKKVTQQSTEYSPETLWDHYERSANPKKDEAARRLEILNSIYSLMQAGSSKNNAIESIAGNKARNSVFRWER